MNKLDKYVKKRGVIYIYIVIALQKNYLNILCNRSLLNYLNR